MDTSKDYYAILGVLPSIDQAALGAVYRALMKKYHPDVFSGSKEEAERISKQLNEAFSVLGDSKKRAEYDRARKAKNPNAGDYDSQSAGETYGTGAKDEALEQDWEVVVRYHPGAEEERQRLAKISYSLALMFQMVILQTKQAENYGYVGEHLRREFLKQYFGSNEDIHRFVLRAISQGRKDVALEVNRAIGVLGTPADKNVRSFLGQVREKHNWDRGWQASVKRAVSRGKKLWIFLGISVVIFSRLLDMPISISLLAALFVFSEIVFKATSVSLVVSRIFFAFVLAVIILTSSYLVYRHVLTTSASNTLAQVQKLQPDTSAVVQPSSPKVALVQPEAPTRPSFDCSKVHSQVLELICNTPALAEADRRLDSAYKTALKNTRGPEALKSDERTWIRSRNNSTANVESLLQIYSDRITFLSTFQNVSSSDVTVSPKAADAIPPAATANSGQKTAAAATDTALGAALDAFNGGAPQVYGTSNRNPRVVLRARGDTRVTVRTADGSFLLNRDLKAGDSYQVPDMAGVTMATSNAGAVEVDLDGIALGRVGSQSQLLGRVSLDPQSLTERFKPH